MPQQSHPYSQQTGKRSGAFTLIEILIVTLILGMLACVSIPQFSRAAQRSTEGLAASQLRSIHAAIAAYKLQHCDRNPDLSKGWTPLLTQTNADGGATGTDLVGPYLSSAPINPVTGGKNITASSCPGVDWLWSPEDGTVTALDAQGRTIIESLWHESDSLQQSKSP